MRDYYVLLLVGALGGVTAAVMLALAAFTLGVGTGERAVSSAARPFTPTPTPTSLPTILPAFAETVNLTDTSLPTNTAVPSNTPVVATQTPSATSTPVPSPEPTPTATPAPFVAREYPERRPDGSVWLVHQWSDGRFEDVRQLMPPSTPTPTPAPSIVREYWEARAGGSYWYVRQWSDGRHEDVSEYRPAPGAQPAPPTAPPPNSVFVQSHLELMLAPSDWQDIPIPVGPAQRFGGSVWVKAGGAVIFSIVAPNGVARWLPVGSRLAPYVTVQGTPYTFDVSPTGSEPSRLRIDNGHWFVSSDVVLDYWYQVQ